jgi:molybdenum cofactor cytidylyltransferase
MQFPGLILLAAGGSSRMKQPKQLLRWGDSSLLQIACTTALQTECRPVIVVLGCEAETCRQEIADLPVTVVVNPEWKKGMGSSIAAGVSALERASPETSGALFLLVDQPTVTSDLLNSLVKGWSPPDLPIAATSYDGSGGVPAIFAKTLFPELKALDPERGARALIAREISRTNLIKPGEALIDLDTPEIYEQQKPKSS